MANVRVADSADQATSLPEVVLLVEVARTNWVTGDHVPDAVKVLVVEVVCCEPEASVGAPKSVLPTDQVTAA